jgi:hypothetical protein
MRRTPFFHSQIGFTFGLKLQTRILRSCVVFILLLYFVFVAALFENPVSRKHMSLRVSADAVHILNKLFLLRRKHIKINLSILSLTLFILVRHTS